jgi:hypothetical protein
LIGDHRQGLIAEAERRVDGEHRGAGLDPTGDIDSLQPRHFLPKLPIHSAFEPQTEYRRLFTLHSQSQAEFFTAGPFPELRGKLHRIRKGHRQNVRDRRIKKTFFKCRNTAEHQKTAAPFRNKLAGHSQLIGAEKAFRDITENNRRVFIQVLLFIGKPVGKFVR